MKFKTPLFLILIAFAITGMTQSAYASVRIFACEPEWGALAHAIGGDDVNIYTATNGLQDPHHIQARPSLIARMRRADMVIATGAQLEIGWLPVLLRQASNTRVQHGQPGYLAAANYVRKLEVPARVDRAMGDIHPAGNPHIQTDPHNIARVAVELVKRLRLIDPAHAKAYQTRYDDFFTRLQAAELRWAKEAAPLRGMRVVVYHKGWAYMNRWLGLIEAGTLEPVPGVPPTTSHLSDLLSKLQVQPATLVLYAAYQDPRAAEWLSKRAHIPAVKLAFTVGGTPDAKDLFSLYDDTINRLLAAAKRGTAK